MLAWASILVPAWSIHQSAAGNPDYLEGQRHVGGGRCKAANHWWWLCNRTEEVLHSGFVGGAGRVTIISIGDGERRASLSG